MKTMKKILAVVLSLAMMVTSITMYNTTVKAAEVATISVSTNKTAYDDSDYDTQWKTFKIIVTSDNFEGADRYEVMVDGNVAKAPDGYAFSKTQGQHSGIPVAVKASAGTHVVTVTAYKYTPGTDDVPENYEELAKGTSAEFTVPETEPVINDGDDWVDATDVGVMDANATVQLQNKFTRDAGLNKGMFGFFGDYTGSKGKTPAWQWSADDWTNAKVFAWVCGNSDLSGISIDGVTYTSDNINVRVAGDCAFISQDLLKVPVGETSHIFNITVLNGQDAAKSAFNMKVTKVATAYAVSVDGTKVSDVNEGDTYTLPTTAKYGYYADEKMYRSGSEVVITKDTNFTSVNDFTLATKAGAGLRLDGDDATGYGLRFQATITDADANTQSVINAQDQVADAQKVIKVGTLIASKAVLDGGVLDFTSITSTPVKAIDILNTGWYGENFGVYNGSVVKIKDLTAQFVSRPYVVINYADGGDSAIIMPEYDVTNARSAAQVAYKMKEANKSDYQNLTDTKKAFVDALAEQCPTEQQ